MSRNKTVPNDVSGSNSDPDMTANGPVFFLIREQAKSIVAIKDLEERLSVLESLQKRLMLAIQNVQEHLETNKIEDLDHLTSASADNKSISDFEVNKKIKPAVELDTASHPNNPEKHESINLTTAAKTDSKGDSINKDSGVVPDYRDDSDNSSTICRASVYCNNENADDELLHLLDIIDQKSLQLLQQVEDIGNQSITNLDTDKSCDKNNRVLQDPQMLEKVVAQRQLSEIKADRDDLRQRLAKLELATDTVIKEKNKLQKELKNAVLENQQLQAKIQTAGDLNELNNLVDCNVLKFSFADAERSKIKKKYLQYSEKSRKKVSLVLKETNIIQLQRQLLTYIMENNVLQAKLADQPNDVSNWIKIETKLKKELKHVTEEKERLEMCLKEKDIEIANLKDRLNYLENELDQENQKNFGLGSNADWRDMGNQNFRANTHLSPMDFGDFSKTQSLPAMIYLDADLKLQNNNMPKNSHERYDTANFTEISLNQSCASNYISTNICSRINSKEIDLVDLNDSNETCASNTSTLLQSDYWNRPSISADWSAPVSVSYCHLHSPQDQNQRWQNLSCARINTTDAKLIHGHLCWKGNRQLSENDLDSIRTEFDPLNETPSCENFVDSLNLSIPLKPTQTVSQLSSIGDSLHSASLDLGCASSAVWHQEHNTKLYNAWSVDGIRQLLVDPETSNFHKHRILPKYSQNSSITSVIDGKTAHPLPYNIVSYRHESSDYQLL